MSADHDVLATTAARAIAYVAGVEDRRVAPDDAALARLGELGGALPEGPSDPGEVLRLLAEVGGPATMASTGPHYYGFVNGATHPAALGASFLASAWDQNAALPVMSPVAAAIHDVTRRWLVELLGLSPDTDVAFVTGATVANASCLAVARDELSMLARMGRPGRRSVRCPADPGGHRRQGAFDPAQVARPGRSRAGPRGHDRAADEQGRMIADLLPDLDPGDGPILLLRPGGRGEHRRVRPVRPIADWVAERDGWFHVDAAFGLWALADPTRAHLVRGLVRADSLATDGHKWLNVTYDCGIAFVQRPDALRRTFAATPATCRPSRGSRRCTTPRSRASGPARSRCGPCCGRSGVPASLALVQQACDCATVIADRLRAADGFEILNDVVLNQVLVRSSLPRPPSALLAEIQRDGRIWCGPTQWDGATAMRISVSSWKTTVVDAERDAAVVVECAGRV
jgi:glutamate/tyrosine decarboxylase-like PLP-dependent enzyme